jgi:hypothetical protein
MRTWPLGGILVPNSPALDCVRQAVPGVRIPPLRSEKPKTRRGAPGYEAGSSRPSGEFGGKSGANSTTQNGTQRRHRMSPGA